MPHHYHRARHTLFSRIGFSLLLIIVISVPPFSAITFAQVTESTTDTRSIKVAPLRDIAITLQRSASATVVSLRSAVIASQLTAEVVAMNLVPGDLVQQGDTIAELDCRDNTLALRAAKSQMAALVARRKLAQQQLDRLSKLKQNRNASEEQINQRQAELNIVNAEISTQSVSIEIAQQQVERCIIRAPFPGLVTETPGNVGNFLTPGTPIITLVDVDQIELQALLLENQLEEIRQNQPTYQSATREWPIHIRTIFPVIDRPTQTREIRFRFDDDAPVAGSIGRLNWTLSGFTLAATYLVQRTNETGDVDIGIFIVDSATADTAQFLPLKNAHPGQPVTIDLDGSTLVVTEGRFGLEDGQKVLIEPANQ